MTSRNQHSTTTQNPCTSITEVAKSEKIVDYSFERDEKSNVLAIHPTRPLIAYLINIQKNQKISKGWSSGNDSSILQSPPASSINGQTATSSNQNISTTKIVSIRIIDYVKGQRCLAKGIYHARPTACVFTINSLVCTQSGLNKLAIVDKMANVYLYDLTYLPSDLVATRSLVIRSPLQDASPYESINLVWCPFVPCEDFDDGDGGLRLALSTDPKIEIFAIDRLQSASGEVQRTELKGAYKCIPNAHKSNIVTLSISPDCSTISSASLDNRVTFFSSDIDDSSQRCLHNWVASMADGKISKLFFLDDYPKLLEDSTMKFWGAAFIGTSNGQMFLVDLRSWAVYQTLHLAPEATSEPKNFDYRIELTSRRVVAVNGRNCYVVQIEHDYARLSASPSNNTTAAKSQNDNLIDTNYSEMMNGGGIFNYLLSKANTAQKASQKVLQAKKQTNSTDTNGPSDGLPRIIKTTKLSLHNPIYSFVIKHKSDVELELFTISAYSLERYIINMNALQENTKAIQPEALISELLKPNKIVTSTTVSATKVVPTQPTVIPRGALPRNDPAVHQQQQQQQLQLHQQPVQYTPTPPGQQHNQQRRSSGAGAGAASGDSSGAAGGKTMRVDVDQMDRLVETLFTKLNTTFSQGLDEFLTDIKCEINDLKVKLNGLSRDVNKLQQQVQDVRHK